MSELPPEPPQEVAEPERQNWMDRALSFIERVGNALPHPGTLFAAMAGLVVVASAITAQFDLEVVHPGTGETIRPLNLMTVEGLHLMLTEMVTNFTSFAPLGTVLVAMLGIGIAEGSGLIGAALRLLVIRAPARLLTFVIVFAGVLSNTASEVGYVLLVPLAAAIFLAAGRHPIAGLAAAFLLVAAPAASAQQQAVPLSDLPRVEQDRIMAENQMRVTDSDLLYQTGKAHAEQGNWKAAASSFERAAERRVRRRSPGVRGAGDPGPALPPRSADAGGADHAGLRGLCPPPGAALQAAHRSAGGRARCAFSHCEGRWRRHG